MEANKTFTIKEVAQLLGFSTNTVYKYVNSGKIQATRLGAGGRFRIPEAEVARLLKIKGIQIPEAVPVSIRESVSEPTVTSEPIAEEKQPSQRGLRSYLLPKDDSLFSPPTLAYWAAGILAVILGITFSLFPIKSFQTLGRGVVIYPIFLKVILITSGFFALITKIFFSGKKRLLDFAHLFLAAVFAFCFLVFCQSGELITAIEAASLFLLLISTLIIPGSEYYKFLILINFLTFALGIILFKRANYFGSDFFILISNRKLLIVFLWLVIFSTSLLLSAISLRKTRMRYKLLPFLFFSFIWFIFTLFSFTKGYLFINRLIFSGFFIALATIAPFWQDIKDSLALTAEGKAKSLFLTLFFLFLGTGLSYRVNLSIGDYILSELARKADSGVSMIDYLLKDARQKTIVFSQNESLIKTLATKEPDRSQINEILKIFYTTSGSSFLRLYVINAEGRVADVYPDDISFENLDVADREYFKKIKQGMNFYLTEGLKPKVNPIPVPAILIMAAPLNGVKEKLLGVLVASLDLTELKNNLDRIKFAKSGNFRLIDNLGNYILHEDTNFFLSSSKGTDLEKTLSGQEKEAVGYNEAGELTYQIFRPIPSVGWGLMVEQPLNDFFYLYVIVTSSIFFSTIVLNLSLIMQICSSEKQK